MLKILAILLSLSSAHAQVGSAKTVTALNAEVPANIATNTSNQITPALLNQVLLDIIASYANTQGNIAGQIPLAAPTTVQSLTIATPLAVAYGGTGDSGTAWSTYSPVTGCLLGAPSNITATGRFKSIGKTVFVNVEATVTSPGSCAAAVEVSLPVTSNNVVPNILVGREINGVNGKELQGITNTATAQILNYDNSAPVATGSILVITGVYESL